MESYKKPVIESAVKIDGAIPALLAGAAAAASAVGFATGLASDFLPHPERRAKLTKAEKKN